MKIPFLISPKTAAGLRRYCISSCAVFIVIAVMLTWATGGCVSVPVSARPPTPTGQGGAPSTPPQAGGQQPVPVLELEKQLIDFQRTLTQAAKDNAECLQNQADHHQKFLEWVYGILVAFLGLVVMLCGGALTFLKYRNRETIEEIVKSQIVSMAADEFKKAKPLMDAELAGAISISRSAIEKELEELRQSTEANRKKLESEFKGDIHNITTLATAMARACALLSLPPSENHKENLNNDQEREEMIRQLKKIQADWAPTNRTIAVFIGRLFRMLKRYKEAVEYLDGVIKTRVEQGENQGEYKQDFAALIYNKACYYNQWANNDDVDAEVREKYREKAWTAIKETVNLCPEYLKNAINDDDFRDLTNTNLHRTWKSLEPK